MGCWYVALKYGDQDHHLRSVLPQQLTSYLGQSISRYKATYHLDKTVTKYEYILHKVAPKVTLKVAATKSLFVRT